MSTTAVSVRAAVNVKVVGQPASTSAQDQRPAEGLVAP